MTDVAVIVPFTTTCEHRLRAWEWVKARYAEHHPAWPIIEGATDVEGFSRTRATRDGCAQIEADVYVVADADVWCDGIDIAAEQALEVGWAIPHLMIHRLSPESTERVLNGEDWRGLPLSTDNRQDSRPYKGHETDTLCAFRADVIRDVPPDPRFVGWGQEGDAWAYALRKLVGKPWRGIEDLVHLWHPPQPRKSRVVGNDKSVALVKQYRQARRPSALRKLLEEAG